MNLYLYSGEFAVCQTLTLPALTVDDGVWFLSCTDEEISLVCETRIVPPKCIAVESGWRLFRAEGPLDFALTGILAGLAKILADAGVPIFAVSTYNTDYLLVKETHLPAALQALEGAGNRIVK